MNIISGVNATFPPGKSKNYSRYGVSMRTDICTQIKSTHRLAHAWGEREREREREETKWYQLIPIYPL